MMFRFTAGLTALVCLILFVILGFFPDTYVSTYGVLPDAGSDFMVRRASPMFAGLALILWLGRAAPPSSLRSAVALGVALTFLGVAFTGIAAFMSGAAGSMILAAAAGEVFIAGLFLISLRR